MKATWLLVAAIIAIVGFNFKASAFDINTISAWGKKKIEPLAYQVETSGKNLRGYTWCDPAMSVYVFYGASSKSSNFSVSSVPCTPVK